MQVPHLRASPEWLAWHDREPPIAEGQLDGSRQVQLLAWLNPESTNASPSSGMIANSPANNRSTFRLVPYATSTAGRPSMTPAPRQARGMPSVPRSNTGRWKTAPNDRFRRDSREVPVARHQNKRSCLSCGPVVRACGSQPTIGQRPSSRRSEATSGGPATRGRNGSPGSLYAELARELECGIARNTKGLSDAR